MISTVRINTNSGVLSSRPDLLMAAASGINDVIQLQGNKSQLLHGGHETAQTIDSLETESFNLKRQQLDLGRFVTLVARHENDRIIECPYYVISDRDFYAENLNFVFGVTNSNISVQSVYRFIQATADQGLQQASVRHIARHEYGHLAGMNDPSDYANPDTRGSIFSGHCANLCTMSQYVSVDQVFEAVTRSASSAVAGFCDDCVNSLHAKA